MAMDIVLLAIGIFLTVRIKQKLHEFNNLATMSPRTTMVKRFWYIIVVVQVFSDYFVATQHLPFGWRRVCFFEQRPA
jgi:hypothetical protein